ncbi:MAG: citrulline utilization hydrolase CtlX [Steroidobacteraceae bacterium]
MMERQTASTVLMVRPAAFCTNEQTASSNHFQSNSHPNGSLIRQAQYEFDKAVLALQQARVEVLVLQDTAEPQKPDAIFPNNWLSTHADGTAVLYPMLAPNRRMERRLDAFAYLRAAGFRVDDIVDLTGNEAHGNYLEGTGSLVLDRVSRTAYACRSPRTSESVLREFASRMNYRVVLFDALDQARRPIYHTNVILAVGRRFAAGCFDCLSAPDAARLKQDLSSTGHSIIELSFSQITAFAGNMLELATATGHCIAMSEQARRALNPEQTSLLEQLGGPLVAADISSIEHCGGGSMRCMLAEIHLPRRVDSGV